MLRTGKALLLLGRLLLVERDDVRIGETGGKKDTEDGQAHGRSIEQG